MVNSEFEAFYEGSVDRVYRALAVSVGDVQLAREATDEGMARAFAHWAKVRAYDNPAGWVFRVGLNWATSWRRKLRREQPLPDILQPARTVDPLGPAALDAMSRLHITHRAVIVCRVLLDLSTAETAAVLRIPEGTVRSRLSRAIAILRTRLVDTSTTKEDR